MPIIKREFLKQKKIMGGGANKAGWVAIENQRQYDAEAKKSEAQSEQ